VPSDLTTVDTVEAGDYTVRVARATDEAGYEAVVVEESSGTGPTPGKMLFFPTPADLRTTDTSDDAEDETPLGPPVTAPHRWVAIGLAIEAYEWGEINEEAADTAEAYREMTVNGEPVADLVNVDFSISGTPVDRRGESDDE